MPPMLLYYTQLKIKMALNSNNILEQLFGVKAKLLKLFLQHPQLILSMKDIVKRTGIKKKRSRKTYFVFY